MRRALSLGVVAAMLVISGCGSDETIIGKPECPDHLVLVAQSVPHAEFVPCFESLPGGWSLNSASIGHNGTTLTLDSDRAGLSAATFAYRDRCEVAGLGRLPSEQEGITAYEDIERLAGGLKSTRYFVFDRGCVSARFDFDGFDDLEYAEDLLASMVLVSREELNQGLQQENEIYEV